MDDMILWYEIIILIIRSIQYHSCSETFKNFFLSSRHDFDLSKTSFLWLMLNVSMPEYSRNWKQRIKLVLFIIVYTMHVYWCFLIENVIFKVLFHTFHYFNDQIDLLDRLKTWTIILNYELYPLCTYSKRILHSNTF